MAETGGGGEVREGAAKVQKSYFDVLGICCSSEVNLVERILNSFQGVHRFSVVVPSRTVIVFHDPLMVSQLQIVNALNSARLEASIRAYGTGKNSGNSWPNPFVITCGLLLLPSAFSHFFHPLRWLAVAAVAAGLPPILLRSYAAIKRYTLDINLLMLVAVGGAIAMKDYEEAGLTVFLFTIAQWLELRASSKASTGMSTLMSLSPQKAIKAETGDVVDAREVQIGTVLAVKVGEMIPIDGVVVEGQSEVDEKMLTGESFPVAKQPKSLVWAGTLNMDGYITVKTTALAEDSAVAKMAKLVEEAQNSRSKTQRMIDICAKYYTPGVIIAAVGVALVPLVTKTKNHKFWYQLALVLLVNACPCALVLSTPVATFCALLKAAKTGILIKGGDVLEELAKTKVVAFDKTGTITRGEFSVVRFWHLNKEVTFERLLYWVSSIESKSSHPLASALVDYARRNSIDPKPESVTNFQSFPGEGIHGDIDGNSVHIGNKRITARAGCREVPKMEDMNEGLTMGYVFLNSEVIGVFTLADTCRTGASDAIKQLKTLGVKTAMLTGDSTAAALHAQSQLEHSIEIVHAELLPEDKADILKGLKITEGAATMVGDGMNDAPALAMANVGISMGISGSAVATETSHVTLLSNDIRKIARAIQLARRTKRKILLNIFLSLATKAIVLGWAIAGHPILWAAILADVGTCLVVILNSMTLLKTTSAKKKTCCNLKHVPHAVDEECTKHTTGLCGSDGRCVESNEGRFLGDHKVVLENGCHHHRESHKHLCWELRKRHRHSCSGKRNNQEDRSVLLEKTHNHCCHDQVKELGHGLHKWNGCHDHKTEKKQSQDHKLHCHGECKEYEPGHNLHCEHEENNCCSGVACEITELPNCCQETVADEIVEEKHEHSIAIDDGRGGGSGCCRAHDDGFETMICCKSSPASMGGTERSQCCKNFRTECTKTTCLGCLKQIPRIVIE